MLRSRIQWKMCGCRPSSSFASLLDCVKNSGLSSYYSSCFPISKPLLLLRLLCTATVHVLFRTAITPAIFTQQSYYRQLGLRDRILNLSLMVAAVLTLLWRQVASVQELNRLLAREDLLWCRATKVSQQALSQRFLAFPSKLFGVVV